MCWAGQAPSTATMVGMQEGESASAMEQLECESEIEGK